MRRMDGGYKKLLSYIETLVILKGMRVLLLKTELRELLEIRSLYVLEVIE